MNGFKKLAPVLAVIALGAFAGPALADSGNGTQKLLLDTHSVADNGFAGPVSTAKPLSPNTVYLIKVKGTYSIWSRSEWLASGPPCGNPLSFPKYPSPGVPNGPTGVDAETVFGAPTTSGLYCGATPRTPTHVTNFQMSNGTGFAYQTPLGGPYSTPQKHNTYYYLMTGAGMTGSFSFRVADFPTSDNYGQLRIAIRPLHRGDCGGASCAMGDDEDDD